MVKYIEGVGETDSAEDSAGAELLQELTRLDRWMTRTIVALSLVFAVLGTWLIVKDDVGHGGLFFAKFVGLTGGISFTAISLTVLAAGIALSRRLIRSIAESRRQCLIAERGLHPNALAWVVAMFKPAEKYPDNKDDR